ncbi:hypothetical protein GCM10020258_37740 [Sphingomonas yabuuchiae]
MTPPTSFAKAARPTYAGIAHELGVAIVSGRMAPGTPLVSEERYSSENGVSRGAYREALRILAAKGLIVNRVKSVTRVTERAKWNMLDLDVLGWMFEGDRRPNSSPASSNCAASSNRPPPCSQPGGVTSGSWHAWAMPWERWSAMACSTLPGGRPIRPFT